MKFCPRCFLKGNGVISLCESGTKRFSDGVISQGQEITYYVTTWYKCFNCYSVYMFNEQLIYAFTSQEVKPEPIANNKPEEDES